MLIVSYYIVNLFYYFILHTNKKNPLTFSLTFPSNCILAYKTYFMIHIIVIKHNPYLSVQFACFAWSSLRTFICWSHRQLSLPSTPSYTLLLHSCCTAFVCNLVTRPAWNARVHSHSTTIVGMRCAHQFYAAVPSRSIITSWVRLLDPTYI